MLLTSTALSLKVLFELEPGLVGFGAEVMRMGREVGWIWEEGVTAREEVDGAVVVEGWIEGVGEKKEVRAAVVVEGERPGDIRGEPDDEGPRYIWLTRGAPVRGGGMSD